ncbi:MAG: hypothetical protein PHE02_12090, partial [Lachnospiraceae bacterium]|nr:hypothetical protein [Lachnospiraceae bacterium]
VNYNFMLRIEGLYDVPCKSVRTFTKENEYEYIQEGGLNDYVHVRRKPISKPFTFQVERYVGTDLWDPMPNGAELILPVLLMVSRYHNDFGKTKRCYVFTGCTVMSKEYGTLDAEKSGLLLETTTISYREMLCVNWPADIDKDKWEFDGKGKKGNGVRSANTDDEELSKNDFIAKAVRWNPKDEKPKKSAADIEKIIGKKPEKKAVKWEFDQKSKAGKGTSSAVQINGEETRSEMQAKAVRWNPKDEAPIKSAADIEKIIGKKPKKEAEKWEFNQKSKSGKGTRRALQINGEKTLGEMEKKAVKWEFNGNRIVGKGKRSATINRSEPRKAQMISDSQKWLFEDDSKEGSGKRSASYDQAESRKKSMESRSQRWDQDKGTGSARRVEAVLGLQNTRKAVKWIYGKNKDGSGTKSAKPSIDRGKAVSKKYDMKSGEVKSAKPSIDRGKAVSREYDFKSRSVQSAKKSESTKPAQRKWPAQKSAKNILDFLKK